MTEQEIDKVMGSSIPIKEAAATLVELMGKEQDPKTRLAAAIAVMETGAELAKSKPKAVAPAMPSFPWGGDGASAGELDQSKEVLQFPPN